ncbi:MAG TPA: TonB-dependent receptor [Candidatus Acidoferrum sp.]|nr:TonB-dependent receptor [Candidatus Acidoferrum sp.]
MKATLLVGVLVSAICLFPASSIARGQGVGASGEISGTVIDPAGAAIPNAKVTVSDVEKGVRRTALADSSGQYRVAGLAPSHYRVSAEFSGFQTEVVPTLTLTVGETLVLDFHLKLAGLSGQIEVTSELPVVETERGSQANTLTQQYIADLPINRRDYLTFTLLTPGVSDSTRMAGDQDFRVKQTPQSGLSFYGSNGRGNSVTVDGGEANGDTGGVRPTLSQDAVQEFQINRSNYSAELGGGSGASINIVSKSGSNNLHGSGYGFFRNDIFDASNPFSFSQALQPGQTFDPVLPDSTGVPIKDALSRQQFGGSVGFPVKKDKSFLFVAFEGLRQDAQTAVPLLTNTNIFRPQSDPLNNQAAILAGLTAGGATPVTCFAGKPAIPAAACAAALTSALTISPTTGLSAGQTARNAFLIRQFEGNGGLFPFNTREYQASGRFDHRFSDRNQVFVRYSYTHDLEENPDLQSLTGFSRGSSIHQYDNTIQASWFHQFSPNTLNEARAQWNYNSFNVIPNVLGQPGLDIPGFANLGNQIFIPSLSILRRPEFADNLTVIRGHHTMKIGGTGLFRGNHTESHTFFPGRFVFGSLTGALLSPCLSAPARCRLAGVNPAVLSSLQTVSLGLPQFYQQGFDNPTVSYTRPFMAAYWQDSWAMRSNFTLNFGVRYELDAQYKPLNTDKDNFAPRVSFAWDPFKDHKTVVRGGFGIFYGPIDDQITTVVKYLGNVNGFRQIAQVFIPLNTPITNSGTIFQTLFAQGKIACTTPLPGQTACITATDLLLFTDPSSVFGPPGVYCGGVVPFPTPCPTAQPITITHTGPNPFFTVLFNGQPDYQNPYSEQGGFGVEREIAGGFSISASYIYVHTLKIPVAIDTNILPAPLAAPKLADGTTSSTMIRQWNVTATGTSGSASAAATAAACPTGAPNLFNAAPTCFRTFGLLQTNQYSSAGSSLYQGGILEIKKRFSNYYTLVGNYTYSKALDTTTDFNSDFAPNDQTCLSCERGLSTFDQRHKVVVAGVFDSPWKGRILSGFELSPIVRYNSSHPFNLLAGTNVNNDRHSTTDRPPGAGRNTGIGPDFVDFDMRLSWRYKMREKSDLQFMAEGFNIFNRTNFGSVNNVVGVKAPPFNVSGNRSLSPSTPLGFTSALPMRQIQLGLRLDF